MKKIFLVFLSFFLLQTVAFAATYQVDTTNSKVRWIGTKVAGQHDGHIFFKSGTVEFEGGSLVGGSAIIDMSSITCHDIKNATYNKKLVDHLKNDDFFATDKFPTAELEIVAINSLGGNDYEVVGNFTIKDKREQIVFKASVVPNGDLLQATAKVKIDRTTFDIRYGSGKFFQNLGDRMIQDEFTLEISVLAKK